MAVDDQTIRDFVAANIDNPQAIADAAAANNISSEQIASAMQLPVTSVNNFFAGSNVAPPTVAKKPTLSFQSSNTGGAVGQATGQASASQIGQIASQAPNLVTALQNGSAAITFNAETGGAELINTQTGQPIGGYEYIQTRPDGNIQINFSDGKGGYVSAVTSVDQQGTLAPITSNNVYTATKAAPDKGGLLSVQNIVAVGLAYALPIVGEAIAAELAVSTSVGTALAAVGTGVAQGQTIEQAIKSAAPSLIASGVMSELELGKLTDNITKDANLQNVINNVANSTVSTALKGGSAKDIFNNAVASGGGTLIGQSLTPDLGTLGASAAGQALATGAVTGNVVAGLTAGAGTAGSLQATQNSYMRDIDNVLNSQASGAPTQKVALDFVDLSKGTQVAGPGGLPNNGFQVGQMTQTAAGLFATLKLSDGTIVNVPVQYNQGAGSLTTNSTNPEVVNQVRLLQVTPENLSKINSVFLDKTPINPNISAEEQAALNKVSSASQNMINALKAGKSIDEYYNTYAYQQSLGDFATQIAQELSKDPTGSDPSFDNLRAEYQKITGTPFSTSTSVTNIPEIIITGKVIRSDPSTGTSTVQTSDGVTINVNSVLPQNSSVAVNKTTSTVIPTSVTNQTATTDTSPVSTTDTTSTAGTTTTTTPTSNVSTSTAPVTTTGTSTTNTTSTTPKSNLTQDIINLLSSNVSPTTITSTDKITDTSTNVPSSNVSVTSGGGDSNVGKVTITGGGDNVSKTSNVTITGGTDNNAAIVTPSIPTGNVTIKDGGVTDSTKKDLSDNNVTITTSYVKPKIKTSYPTIVGQFANPLTPAVSAYRPAGEIESQATGKEREDVWNTESLRNALGI
jgi:hypothetical protein